MPTHTGKDLRDNSPGGRRAGGRARGVGGGHGLLRAQPARLLAGGGAAHRAALRRKVELCGVFVNAPMEEIVGDSEELGLTLLQLHGDEGPSFCAEAARRTGARVIKALQVSGIGDMRDVERFHTDFHLLDARSTDAWTRAVARRHRRDVRLGAAGRAALEDAADPERWPEPGNVARGDRAGAPVRGRQRQRHRERPRAARTRQAARRSSPPWRAGAARRAASSSRRSRD